MFAPRCLLLLLSATCAASGAPPERPVFPGARGFGIGSPAGRGGRIIRVTNLDSAGPGSLRAALAAGPRIVVFEAGGELGQIQFLLGHVSIQTTQRYLGCKQRIRSAVNDRIGLDPRRDAA